MIFSIALEMRDKEESEGAT